MKSMENENQLHSLILVIPSRSTFNTTLGFFIVQVINNKELKYFTFLKSLSSQRSQCDSLIQLPELHLVIIWGSLHPEVNFDELCDTANSHFILQSVQKKNA